jgi:hypothetical protein
MFSSSPLPLSQFFFEGIWDWDKDIATLTGGTGLFLKLDEIFIVLGAAVWILLCFRDLKRERRVNVGWVRILVTMLGVGMSLGPGASMALIWSWREEVLVGKEGTWE